MQRDGYLHDRSTEPQQSRSRGCYGPAFDPSVRADGETSPYPTVVTVTKTYHIACGQPRIEPQTTIAWSNLRCGVSRVVRDSVERPLRYAWDVGEGLSKGHARAFRVAGREAGTLPQ